MIDVTGDRVAVATAAEIVTRGGDERPSRAVVDSREVRSGDLFVGLRGDNADGGDFAAAALAAGAWGVLVGPEHAAGLEGGWVFSSSDPLTALGALAREWRRELGARVVGVTGSVGKTSV